MGELVRVLGAYGAFTVGAEIRGEPTRLEIDLADLKSAPKPFRDA